MYSMESTIRVGTYLVRTVSFEAFCSMLKLLKAGGMEIKAL